MTDRERILHSIQASQPAFNPLPEIALPPEEGIDLAAKFMQVLTTIGGQVFTAGQGDYQQYIRNSGVQDPQVIDLTEDATAFENEQLDPHTLENVDFAIINAHFGVAENGAVWITEDLLGYRVLPFISQELIVILSAQNIVANMHEAYQRIGDTNYGFGTFIAGPSKTADIEQSLVLGAHGARRMTVFLTAYSLKNANIVIADICARDEKLFKDLTD